MSESHDLKTLGVVLSASRLELIPEQVFNNWLRPLSLSDITVQPGGFSGAVVYHCRATQSDPFGANEWALKRWPNGTTGERVEQVHTVVNLARENGCRLLPRFASTSGRRELIVVDSTCWDLSQWMPGAPLSRQATLEEIADGAAAIASFHAAVRVNWASAINRASATEFDRGVSKAIEDRIERLAKLNSELPTALEVPLPASIPDELATAIRIASDLLRNRWPEAAPQIANELNVWSDRRVYTQYILRDIHREHLLFDVASQGLALGTRTPSGLIDFDAIRVDSPAVDLARWTASFFSPLNSISDRLAAAASGYRRICDLNNEQIQLAETFVHVSRWINLANWVVWIVLGSRLFVNSANEISLRISDLIEQLGERDHCER